MQGDGDDNINDLVLPCGRCQRRYQIASQQGCKLWLICVLEGMNGRAQRLGKEGDGTRHGDWVINATDAGRTEGRAGLGLATARAAGLRNGSHGLRASVTEEGAGLAAGNAAWRKHKVRQGQRRAAERRYHARSIARCRSVPGRGGDVREPRDPQETTFAGDH